MTQKTISETDSTYVLALGDLTREQASLAGAKAANLGELSRAGFPVPDGFVLTTQAFERFMLNAGSSPQEIATTNFPPELERSLRAALTNFGETALAVRSSTLAEDLPNASFAGQYETVLDVRGFGALVNAVRRCWASAFGERVLAYQSLKSNQDNNGMAVLVQRMVRADAAGVAFSANRLTGDRGECVVNAVRGLGERLVSGQAIPDEWVARGELLICRNASEGAITESQACAIVGLARSVESHFGEPQDIEWAIAHGEIFLLQARPITTLTGTDENYTIPQIADPSTSDLTWEWDDEHSAVPVLPLNSDSVNVVWTGGSKYRAKWLHIPYVVEYRVINGYAYFTEHFLEADREKVVEQVKQAKRAHARVLGEYWDREVWPAFSRTYQWMQSLDVEGAPLSEVATMWEEYWNRCPRLMGLHYMISSIVYQALDDLIDLYSSLFEKTNPNVSMMLLQGLSNELHRASRDLYKLVETARMSAALTKLIVDDADHTLTTLAETTQGREFLDKMNVFLSAHGHLGQSSIDFTSPSWEDEPARLLIEVRKQLLHRGEDPQQRHKRLIAEAEAFTTHTRERLHGRPGDLQNFEDTLALAQAVAPFKEDHNYWLDRMWQAHTHRFVLKVAGRLVAANVLSESWDVVFLHIKEVSEALNQPRDLRQIITERKAEHARWISIIPPKYLGKIPGTSTDTSHMGANAPQGEPNVLRGMAACAGKVSGPARLVHSAEDFGRVQPGDVLVCASPNPSWVALYTIVSALVTDRGGTLSHAAVLAREFGVPAVVGTGIATREIRDGQLVEVDGTAGQVRMLL